MVPNTQVISDNAITLTSHRVRHCVGKNVTSIPLHKISCIKVHYIESYYLLVIGIIVGIIGVWLMVDEDIPSEQALIMFIICFVFVGIYFATRKHVVSIFSDSGEHISFHTKGISNENVQGFINEIEGAIHRL